MSLYRGSPKVVLACVTAVIDEIPVKLGRTGSDWSLDKAVAERCPKFNGEAAPDVVEWDGFEVVYEGRCGYISKLCGHVEGSSGF